MRSAPARPQRGLTLIELMIAMAVGLLVLLVAGLLLQQARSAYQDLDDANRVQESGRMALAHLQQALRQAGHLPWEQHDGTTPMPPPDGLRGLDDSRQVEALDPAAGLFGRSSGDGLNHSDVLMIGFFGAPAASHTEVTNCSGAAASSAAPEAAQRHWVIYYIAAGAGAEAELRCRYQGRHGNWTSDALVPGVEAMQLRYAIDSDADGSPDRWHDASNLSETQWQQVRLVRIALLVRGQRRRPGASGTAARSYDLLLPGRQSDPAWRFTEQAGEQRQRAVFQSTVLLRNHPAAGSLP